MAENNVKKFVSKHTKEYRLKDFQFIELLGKGQFGKVYLAREITSGNEIAIKKIDIFKSTSTRTGDFDPKALDQINEEFDLLCAMNHPNILKGWGGFIDKGSAFFMMEKAQTSLYDLLKKKGRLQPDVVANYLSQIILGINYMHQKHIWHRDVKLENCLLFGEKNETLKLCDFGTSKMTSLEFRNTFIGTPDYLSPEMVRGGGYRKTVDFWSTGVLCYELLCGKQPFRTSYSSKKGPELMKQIEKNIKHKELEWPRLHFYENEEEQLYSDAKAFTIQMLKKEIGERLKLIDMVEHELFKNHREAMYLFKYEPYIQALVH